MPRAPNGTPDVYGFGTGQPNQQNATRIEHDLYVAGRIIEDDPFRVSACGPFAGSFIHNPLRARVMTCEFDSFTTVAAASAAISNSAWSDTVPGWAATAGTTAGSHSFTSFGKGMPRLIYNLITGANIGDTVRMQPLFSSGISGGGFNTLNKQIAQWLGNQFNLHTAFGAYAASSATALGDCFVGLAKAPFSHDYTGATTTDQLFGISIIAGVPHFLWRPTSSVLMDLNLGQNWNTTTAFIPATSNAGAQGINEFQININWDKLLVEVAFRKTQGAPATWLYDYNYTGYPPSVAEQKGGAQWQTKSIAIPQQTMSDLDLGANGLTQMAPIIAAKNTAGGAAAGISIDNYFLSVER
jgi:hypothetical protein